MTPFLRHQLLPRVVFLPYWAALTVFSLLSLLRCLFGGSVRERRETKLMLEAGARGWELLEYKELLASACEYLGDERVTKIIIDKGSSYPRQVYAAFNKHRPSHYLYDPRTGSENWAYGLLQAFGIGLLCTWYRVTPIVLLTDLSIRSWRAQSAVVSARSGVVINYMVPRAIAPIFPHRRLIGPHLMPLSVATFEAISLSSNTNQNKPASVRFVGSLYEPRTTILNGIDQGLKERGYTLTLMGREFGSARCSDEEYWSRIQDAAIVVTTTEQIVGPRSDWSWNTQLVYRFLEATACGVLLVAPEVPGAQRFFTPGEHYVAFSSAAEAVDRIAWYLEHPEERKGIALAGHRRARALVESRFYWTSIDISLGRDSFT